MKALLLCGLVCLLNTLLLAEAALPSAVSATKAAAERGYITVHSDDFLDHYPTSSLGGFDLSQLAQEAPVVVWNGPDHERKVTVFRTDGTKGIEQKAVIRIEGRGLAQLEELSMKDFRALTVTWINDKLIYIDANISHITNVQAIYDVEKHVWLYRESVQYLDVQPGV
jgi:hypothetical protein